MQSDYARRMDAFASGNEEATMLFKSWRGKRNSTDGTGLLLGLTEETPTDGGGAILHFPAEDRSPALVASQNECARVERRRGLLANETSIPTTEEALPSFD